MNWTTRLSSIAGSRVGVCVRHHAWVVLVVFMAGNRLYQIVLDVETCVCVRVITCDKRHHHFPLRTRTVSSDEQCIRTVPVNF